MGGFLVGGRIGGMLCAFFFTGLVEKDLFVSVHRGLVVVVDWWRK